MTTAEKIYKILSRLEEDDAPGERAKCGSEGREGEEPREPRTREGKDPPTV